MKKALFAAHRALTQRMFERDPARLYIHERAALWLVRWGVDRFEMWRLRHGPTIGCPNCRHYDRICDTCRAQRKEMWG